MKIASDLKWDKTNSSLDTMFETAYKGFVLRVLKYEQESEYDPTITVLELHVIDDMSNKILEYHSGVDDKEQLCSIWQDARRIALDVDAKVRALLEN